VPPRSTLEFAPRDLDIAAELFIALQLAVISLPFSLKLGYTDIKLKMPGFWPRLLTHSPMFEAARAFMVPVFNKRVFCHPERARPMSKLGQHCGESRDLTGNAACFKSPESTRCHARQAPKAQSLEPRASSGFMVALFTNSELSPLPLPMVRAGGGGVGPVDEAPISSNCLSSKFAKSTHRSGGGGCVGLPPKVEQTRTNCSFEPRAQSRKSSVSETTHERAARHRSPRASSGFMYPLFTNSVMSSGTPLRGLGRELSIQTPHSARWPDFHSAATPGFMVPLFTNSESSPLPLPMVRAGGGGVGPVDEAPILPNCLLSKPAKSTHRSGGGGSGRSSPRASLSFMYPFLNKNLTPALSLALAFAVTGCHHNTPPTPSPTASSTNPTAFVAPGTDPWKLTCTDPKTTTPALLWNGHIGFRLGPTGNCLDAQGQPLPMFWAVDYEPTGQERLRPTTCPLTVAFAELSSTPKTYQMQDWSQSLDMSNGKVETSYVEHYDDNDIRILTTSVINPNKTSVGQEWHVTPTKDATIDVTLDFKDFKVGVSPDQVVWGDAKGAQVHCASSPNVQGLTKPDFFSQKPVSVTLRAGQTLTFSTALNFYSDKELQPEDVFFISKGKGGYGKSDLPDKSFDEVAQASTKALAGENQPDIEIDGPIEDQQAIRSFIYYLRSGVDQTNSMEPAPVSPFGMSNSLYDGHVFWDADTWVLPALAFIDPNAARTIPAYRLAREPAARENFEDWISHMGPTADPKLFVGPKSIAGLAIGDKFPWESSVTGKETVTGPSRFEEHISGDVAFVEGQAASLGLIDEQKAEDVERLVASYYRHRSEKGPDGRLGIRAVMSPDENHIGDNDLYTNLVAQWCENGGGWEPDPSKVVFSDIPPIDTYYLPKDQTSFLTYDNDPIKGYKQAAAVLAIYPLQYPPAEQQAKVMMDRFADKVIKNGPAMTDSVHAIIWARIGESDKAYDAWRHGWMDFVRPPFLLFSEKRNQDRTYFTTGAAGELQSVVYGFLGFRIDSKPEAGASWSLKLKGDRWLSIKPNLPKEWKRVTFRNFHVLGKTYTLTATHQSVQVTPGE
jgi:trehalose/maltose hydrolase-like predicted phosphorylase